MNKCVSGEAYLYTNSYSDLVTIDISNPANMKIGSTGSGIHFRDMSPFIGLMGSPQKLDIMNALRYDSVVVGWVKDSIYAGCNKIN